MALLIDQPRWTAHGRAWSHLISDVSLTELHDFAHRVGLPPRGFEGDHYDVPEERYAAVVAAGARPTEGGDLVRALHRSGLRMQKRKGDKGVSRQLDVTFPDGLLVDVDLFVAEKPFDPRRVFAAMVFVTDAGGDFAAVYSVWRQQWGPPGGGREGSEPVPQNAIREVFEETGLALTEASLRPCGYERFRLGPGRWMGEPGQDVLQCYLASVSGRRPPLSSEMTDTSERRWVDPDEFTRLCQGYFWWPLAARIFGLPAGHQGR